MYQRAVAGQAVGFELILTDSLDPAIGANPTAWVSLDGGPQQLAGGTVSEKGQGQYIFISASEDFDCSVCSLVLLAPGVVPAEKTIIPFDPASAILGVYVSQDYMPAVGGVRSTLALVNSDGLFWAAAGPSAAALRLQNAGPTQTGSITQFDQTIAGTKTILTTGRGTAFAGLVLSNPAPSTASVFQQNSGSVDFRGTMWDVTNLDSVAIRMVETLEALDYNAPVRSQLVWTSIVGSNPAELIMSLQSDGFLCPLGYGIIDPYLYADGDILVFSAATGRFVMTPASSVIGPGTITFSQITGWPLPLNLGGTGANLSSGTFGQVVTFGSGSLYPAFAPGQQFDWATVTSGGLMTATTPATASLLFDSPGASYDGSTRVRIEVFIPLYVDNSGKCTFILARGTTWLGLISQSGAAGVAGSLYSVVYDLPPVGSAQYAVYGYSDSGNGAWYAGAGGAPGTLVPAFIRVTKA